MGGKGATNARGVAILSTCKVATHEGAAIFAEALRIMVAREPVRYQDEVIPVTISLGVAVAVVDDPTLYNSQDLIRRADEKLYEAKRAGRNRVAL